MPRSCMSMLSAATVALAGATQAAGQDVCRPALAFQDVQFSEMQRPTLERRWLAVVSVDAARCVAGSTGNFEIVLSRLKENGPDIEVREKFMWQPPSVKVEVNFWADEAVERYRFDNIAPCPCGR
jgi:hypothetical protein